MKAGWKQMKAESKQIKAESKQNESNTKASRRWLLLRLPRKPSKNRRTEIGDIPPASITNLTITLWVAGAWRRQTMTMRTGFCQTQGQSSADSRCDMLKLNCSFDQKAWLLASQLAPFASVDEGVAWEGLWSLVASATSLPRQAALVPSLDVAANNSKNPQASQELWLHCRF